MNPTDLAMKRPITTLILDAASISGEFLAQSHMRVEIFSPLNATRIYA